MAHFQKDESFCGNFNGVAYKVYLLACDYEVHCTGPCYRLGLPELTITII